MKNYILIVATAMAFTTSVAASYAQPAPTPPVPIDAAAEPATGPDDANLAPLEDAEREAINYGAENTDPTPADKAAKHPVGTATDVVNDIRTGNWREAVAGFLALLMLGLGKTRGKIGWFRGDRGGAVLVLTLALAGTVSAALASDAALDWRLFAGAISLATSSAGGYVLIKKIFWPRRN